jgi:hypothetical protein
MFLLDREFSETPIISQNKVSPSKAQTRLINVIKMT